MATPTPSPTPAPPRPTSAAPPTPIRPSGPPPSISAAARPAAARPAVPSRAALVKRGQLQAPMRLLAYGPEGVGKSALVADADRALFLDIEGGTQYLDVARYPFNPGEPDESVPRSYEQVLAALDDLAFNPWPDVGTVGIDTVDRLEALIHRFICARAGGDKKGIEDFGYGKGYVQAVEELRLLLAKLDAIRARGKTIVLIGHSAVTPFKNPEGEDYDRYQLHVHKNFGGQIKEWCDVVAFLRFEGGSSKIAGDKSQAARARGWTTGRRMMQLTREAAWDAKCRLPMPTEVELEAARPWQPFRDAVLAARDPKILGELIAAELDRIGVEDFATKAGRAMSRSAVLDFTAKCVDKGDASTLQRVLAGLRDIASPLVTESQES